MAAWKDRVKQSVTTGGVGAIVISTAAAGYQALGASDDAKVFPYVIEDGTAWETGYGIYTHSGTSFARTSRDGSSTGSALNVTTSAFLFVDLTAARALSADNGARGAPPGGRLTVVSGVPVPTADATAIAIWYTPYLSDVITLWDGNLWAALTFAETQMSLGSLVPNVNYDVFGYLSSGALALESAVWKNATVTMTIANPGVVTWNAHGMSNNEPFVVMTSGALPTPLVAGTVYYVVSSATNTFQLALTPGGAAIQTSGSQSGTHTGYSSSARQTTVTIQDGRYCKNGDKTRLWLGSFRTNNAGTVASDGVTARFLFNAYNRVPRTLWINDPTSSWTYTSVNWRQARAQTSARVEILNGLAGLPININISQVSQNTSLGSAQVAVGVDSVTVQAAHSQGSQSVAGGALYGMASAVYNDYVSLGYHAFNWLERLSGSTTCIFYGSAIDTNSGNGGAYTNGMGGQWAC